MIYNGIIFDFNGVLWWDGLLQEQAWRQFALTLRDSPLSDEELIREVHGRPNRHTLEYITGRELSGEEIHRLTQAKETIYRKLCLDEGPEFILSPGAVDLLDYLKAGEIRRTIATASERTNLEFFIKHFKLADWLDVNLIVYDDGYLPGKPAPDVYLKAAQNLGLRPEQCMVIEDSVSGIQAARDAGIGYIAALGPQDQHARLAALDGVDIVLTDLGEFDRELLQGDDAIY